MLRNARDPDHRVLCPIISPFYSLARAAWIPYAYVRDAVTGEARGVEGPNGFETYRELQASRFLRVDR